MVNEDLFHWKATIPGAVSTLFPPLYLQIFLPLAIHFLLKTHSKTKTELTMREDALSKTPLNFFPKKILNFNSKIHHMKEESSKLTLWFQTSIHTSHQKWNSTPRSGIQTLVPLPELSAWTSLRTNGRLLWASEPPFSASRPLCAALSLMILKTLLSPNSIKATSRSSTNKQSNFWQIFLVAIFWKYFLFFLIFFRAWADKYANPEALENAKIKKLTEMGFTDQQARTALEKVGWDEESAIEALLG